MPTPGAGAAGRAALLTGLCLAALCVHRARLVAQTTPKPPSTTAPKPQTPAPKSPVGTAPSATPSPKLTLATAIDQLGKLDYPTRVAASRFVRRTAAAAAVPSLVKAVGSHPDGYVRFRALVLLAGFNDPRARDVMLAAIDDPNDRLRDVAYSWFETHPDPTLAPRLLARLDKELSEFVRPSLVRALAAIGSDPAVQKALVRDANRGQDLFRSTVIEALGEHRAAYAVPALIAIAKLDGPLQDDAVLALGQIGDKRALETLAQLQRTAPRERQAALAAAICLLGVNCESHERFLVETLRFTTVNMGFQELARSAARGLTELAKRDRVDSWNALLELGIPSVDPYARRSRWRRPPPRWRVRPRS